MKIIIFLYMVNNRDIFNYTVLRAPAWDIKLTTILVKMLDFIS